MVRGAVEPGDAPTGASTGSGGSCMHGGSLRLAALHAWLPADVLLTDQIGTALLLLADVIIVQIRHEIASGACVRSGSAGVCTSPPPALTIWLATPSRPQLLHAVSGAGRKLPHEMPLVQQVAAKAAAVAQAREQTGWQSPHVRFARRAWRRPGCP